MKATGRTQPPVAKSGSGHAKAPQQGIRLERLWVLCAHTTGTIRFTGRFYSIKTRCFCVSPTSHRVAEIIDAWFGQRTGDVAYLRARTLPALNQPHFSAILAPMKQSEIPLVAPHWNSANSLESFKHFAQSIHEQAKAMLLKDKTHGEMFFFMALTGQGHIVLWQNTDRDLQADWIRQHIHDHYSYGVIHICEAWAHFSKHPNEHTQKQLQAGEMRVSELRPEDRTEILMVSAQSRDGYSHSWADEILRNKDSGTLWLGECKEFENFTGRFGKLFG